MRFVDVADLALYTQVPDDWSVIITDVQGSTKAIEAGRYKDVNSLGVASIVAVRNALPGVDIPFVFGGDGATLLCPTALLPGVEVALRGLQDLATSVFELGMRAGVVTTRTLDGRISSGPRRPPESWPEPILNNLPELLLWLRR